MTRMLFTLLIMGYCTFAAAQNTPDNNFFTPVDPASIKKNQP